MDDNLEYLMRRHLMELMQSETTASPEARKLHQELAERYADRIDARYFFYPSVTKRWLREARNSLRRSLRRRKDSRRSSIVSRHTKRPMPG